MELDFEDFFDAEVLDFEDASFGVSATFGGSASSSGSFGVGNAKKKSSKKTSTPSKPGLFDIKADFNIPVYYESGNNKVKFNPTKAPDILKYFTNVAKEIPLMVKEFNYPASKIPKYWMVQQIINRATGHRNLAAEKAIKLKLQGPTVSVAARVTLPDANNPFWKTDLGKAVAANNIELAKVKANGIAKYIEQIKAAMAIKALTTMKVPPKPISVMAAPRSAPARVPQALVLKPSAQKSHVQLNLATLVKPPQKGVLPQVKLPELKEDCSCDSKMVPVSAVETKPSKGAGADGFWNSPLGKEILSNPEELAKFKANPTGYIQAINQLGPFVAHIKDVAMFLGCNASNDQIKAYLEHLALQQRATQEHIQLNKENVFREATIGKLKNILNILPTANAITIIRTACGIG